MRGQLIGYIDGYVYYACEDKSLRMYKFTNYRTSTYINNPDLELFKLLANRVNIEQFNYELLSIILFGFKWDFDAFSHERTKCKVLDGYAMDIYKKYKDLPFNEFTETLYHALMEGINNYPSDYQGDLLE